MYTVQLFFFMRDDVLCVELFNDLKNMLVSLYDARRFDALLLIAMINVAELNTKKKLHCVHIASFCMSFGWGMKHNGENEANKKKYTSKRLTKLSAGGLEMESGSQICCINMKMFYVAKIYSEW